MENLAGCTVLDNIFDVEKLITERVWDVLREGVFISFIYNTEGGAQAAFLHYLPGASIPRHVHTGFEHILILQGSQEDGEKTYQKGTLVIHRPDSSHEISSPEGCFALGIWEKPNTFQ